MQYVVNCALVYRGESLLPPLGAFYLEGNGERNTLLHTACENVFAVRTLEL